MKSIVLAALILAFPLLSYGGNDDSNIVNFTPPDPFPQLGTNTKVDASGNLLVNCAVGCSAGASFSDNSAFTIGTSSVNVLAGYFTSGADPSLTTGNAARARIDAHSYLLVDCAVGCSGGATTPTDAFANPTTAGLAFSFLAGWNGTTWDRLKSSTANGLQVDVTRVTGNVAVTGTFFQTTQPVSIAAAVGVTQSTSPWIVAGGGTAGSPGSAVLTVQGISGGQAVPVTLTSTTITGTVGVTQSTSPWVVSCTAANCALNETQVAGQTLGSTAIVNYGSTPAAALVPAVNAFITNTPAVTLASTTITGTVGVTQSTSPWVVSQGTAANLNATVVPGGSAIFEVSPTTAANTNANPFFTSLTDGTTKVTVISATAALKTDLSSVAGTATSTAAAGVVKVGVVGNAGAAVDAANNAALPANVVMEGVQTIAQGTQPTAATANNARYALASTEGVQYVQLGNSNVFSCIVQAVTVTTQCQAAPAAGLRAYVVSVNLSNQAATVQTLDIVFGTGTNCATGATAITHKYQFGTAATTTSPQEVSSTFMTPLVPTAANAICVRPSAATAFGATITGFIAP